jgi:hypothetical protein
VLYWIGMTVMGLCASFSFYMVWLLVETGDQRGGPWVFGAFGCLFAIPFCAAMIRLAAKRFALFGRIDRTLDRGILGSDEPRTVFVPHWSMMTMIVTAVIGILVAILVPLFFR